MGAPGPRRSRGGRRRVRSETPPPMRHRAGARSRARRLDSRARVERADSPRSPRRSPAGVGGSRSRDSSCAHRCQRLTQGSAATSARETTLRRGPFLGRAGASTATVSRLENGIALPRDPIIDAIIDAYCVVTGVPRLELLERAAADWQKDDYGEVKGL